MSGDDDNFDIDIYGDAEGQQADSKDNHDDDLNFDDANYQYDGINDAPEHIENDQKADTPSQSQTSTMSVQAGTKRKAEDYDFDDQSSAQQQNNAAYESNQLQSEDPRPQDPHATAALKFGELHWWTTEEDMRLFCARAGVEDQLLDIAFGEHKINGKSRGEAYMEFCTPYAADAVKREVEKKEPGKDGAEPKKPHPFTVWFTSVSNPFKGRDSGAMGKKDTGAYNSFGNRGGGEGFRGRGGFDRGRGGFRGGGGYQNRGGFQNNNNNHNHNNMAPQVGYNAPMGGMGGFANPMMGMSNIMGNMMGMGNMARGGMMGGRGGFGMNPMGMGGMMPGRGGMMNQRGGWGVGGGGYPQGGMQSGYNGGGGGYGMGQQQQQQQQPPNKRMKPE